jgi:4-hydroxy-tetrahydrodipicolinate synthase
MLYDGNANWTRWLNGWIVEHMSLTGLFVPLVTPFTATGELAVDALETLARAVLDDGATGLVALGTTAESATLSARERHTIVDVCAEVCGDRGAPLIVGTGSNSTAQSVDVLAELDPRAAAVLAVVPYYSRPSEDGVVEHFRRVAAACPVPVLVYHVPYRTGRPLTADTLSLLAQIPNVVGFKHSVGGIDDATVEFMSASSADTSVLAGDDLHAAALLALGASGAVLASANVATRAYADLVAAWRAGPTDDARRLQNRLVPLTRALFAEPNPVVIKAVLAARGQLPSPYVRLPLLASSATATAGALECWPVNERRASGSPR